MHCSRYPGCSILSLSIWGFLAFIFFDGIVFVLIDDPVGDNVHFVRAVVPGDAEADGVSVDPLHGNFIDEYPILSPFQVKRPFIGSEFLQKSICDAELRVGDGTMDIGESLRGEYEKEDDEEDIGFHRMVSLRHFTR